MKVTFSIYLLSCLQLMAFSSFSQEKVTLQLKNQALEKILKQIEQQTSFGFIYNNDEIDASQKLNVTVFEERLEETLDLLFNNISVKYVIKGKHIILSARSTSNNTREVQKFTLSGTIKDEESGETLIGASLFSKRLKKGSVANEYGFYSITLPKDTYTFHIVYVGYNTQVIEIDLSKNTKLDIGLIPSSNELNEVVITFNETDKSQVKNILTGVSTMKSSDIKQLPSFLGEPDITRAILTQPGVSSNGEGTSGFNVRGGNIDQNLILLDEAPLYNSSHLWGLFSVFNADAIKDLKLYKGGIPARYGGRGSSVLDIRQKEGNSKKFKGEGGVGLLFSRLTLEGPIIKDKLNFLISGRRSYFDLFFPLGPEEIKHNKIFFYDFNSKISWKINGKSRLYASGYFGADVMKLSFSGGETNNNGTKPPDSSIDFRWKNATGTIRWNYIFSNKLFLNVSGVYSIYNYALISKNDTGGVPGGTTGTFNWKSSVENFIFKPDFTYYMSPDTKFRFGVNSTYYRFTPAKLSSNEPDVNNLNFYAENGLEVAPYLEVEQQWNKFSINAGLRYSWFGNLGSTEVSNYTDGFPLTASTLTGSTKYASGEIVTSYSGFEPRLSIKYALKENQALKIGYNRMLQYMHLISNTSSALPFDVWKPAGKYVKPLEVNQVSGGYAYDTPNGIFNFSVEGYYKSFKNILEYKNGADLFLTKNLETQLLPADGFSYGIELAVIKNEGKFTGNINYTYSVTQRKTTSAFSNENINSGNYYSSNYDRPHMMNLTGNYKLGKNWTIGAFFTFQTGRPTSQPSGRFIFDGNPYLTYSDRNAFRLSNTHRLDLSVTFTPNRKPNQKWLGSWNVGVYNVYGHDNAFSVYSTFNNSILKSFQFSVIGQPIPFVTYNFKF